MRLSTIVVLCSRHRRTVLLVLLFAAIQGNTETECEVNEGTILKCKFSQNLEATGTDFTIYFDYDYGKKELVADCSWNNSQPLCILQDGVQLKEPVSDIAVISLPPRLTSVPGSYRCIPDGANSEDSKACQFHKTQKEGDDIQENSTKRDRPVETKNQHNQNEADPIISSIIGVALGVVSVIVIMVFVVNSSRTFCFLTPKSKNICLISLSSYQKNPRGSTENNAIEKDSDATLTNRSSSSEQASSRGRKEDNPLLQSEKITDI